MNSPFDNVAKRQAFRPGEVTPEEANRIGRELALKLTKGNHAFVVCTHVDKRHVHNHIIINSTTLDCRKKFRNFWGSAWAIRHMDGKPETALPPGTAAVGCRRGPGRKA